MKIVLPNKFEKKTKENRSDLAKRVLRLRKTLAGLMLGLSKSSMSLLQQSFTDNLTIETFQVQQ